MNDIVNLITTLGFPIFCCLGLGWFIQDTLNKNREENKEDKSRLYKTLGELTATNTSLVKNNDEIVKTNQILAKDLKQELKENYKKIDDKLDKVLQK